MIENDQQLKNTRCKLARLEHRAAVLEQRLQVEPASDARCITLYSYRGLIRQLREEMIRYELGIEPPSEQYQ